MPTIARKIEITLCTEGLSDEQKKEQWGMLYHINDYIQLREIKSSVLS